MGVYITLRRLKDANSRKAITSVRLDRPIKAIIVVHLDRLFVPTTTTSYFNDPHREAVKGPTRHERFGRIQRSSVVVLRP